MEFSRTKVYSCLGITVDWDRFRFGGTMTLEHVT